MVRFKNRYLLFEIVYADTPLGWTSIPASTTSILGSAQQSATPDLSPFGDTGRHNCRLPQLSNKDFMFALKDSIAENFGDYGAGLTQRPLTHSGKGKARNKVGQFATQDSHAFTSIIPLGTIRHCQLQTIRYDRDRIMFLRNQAQLLKDTQTFTQLGAAFKDSADAVNALEI
ncbi:hypothetical protein EDD11_000119 [Mortierella claussenii]|nr:hypothetical protein EDD11_000119 [Mortierella claussenii]